MFKSLFALPILLFAAASASAADHAVSVGGNSLSFSPSSLTINKGDTVTFHNAGGFHNAISDSGLFTSGQASSTGWTYTTPAFDSVGSFGYYCAIHGGPGGTGMSGMITVQDYGPPPPPPPPAFAIVPGITGSWYLPDQSGHGFNVEVLKGPGLDNGFLAFWYVYDNSGNNLWLVSQGSYVGDTATLQVQQVSGGLFPPNFDKTKIVRSQWGTLTLKFSDCNNATAQWNPIVPGYPSGSMSLVRLSGISGLACP